MNHEELITKIIRLDLKLQCYGKGCVISAKRVYLLKNYNSY